MRTVVDTNVVAYLLLRTEPFVKEVLRFWRIVDDPIAPSLWEAELANVVWMAVRAGIIGPDEGLARLRFASMLKIRSIPTRTLWLGALDRSIQSGVAVYDTLFIELAEREHIALATFDTRVLTVFPSVAKRPSDLVSK